MHLKLIYIGSFSVGSNLNMRTFKTRLNLARFPRFTLKILFTWEALVYFAVFSGDAMEGSGNLCDWWISKGTLVFTVERGWMLPKTGRTPVTFLPENLLFSHHLSRIKYCQTRNVLVEGAVVARKAQVGF